HGAAVDQLAPLLVERRKAFANPRPTRPVVDFRREPAQYLRVFGVPQDAGNAAQDRGEDEVLHPRDRPLQRVEKLQEEAAVQVHRAGNVAEGDDARLARLAPAEAKVERLDQGPTHRPAQIDPATAMRGRPTPTGPRREAPGDTGGDALDLRELVGAE